MKANAFRQCANIYDALYRVIYTRDRGISTPLSSSCSREVDESSFDISPDELERELDLRHQDLQTLVSAFLPPAGGTGEPRFLFLRRP